MTGIAEFHEPERLMYGTKYILESTNFLLKIREAACQTVSSGSRSCSPSHNIAFRLHLDFLHPLRFVEFVMERLSAL
jgi:hypothetical protein